MLHYWTRVKPSAKAQKPSAKALPRTALGKEPSENFESAKRFLPMTKKKPSEKKTSAKCKLKKKTRKNSKIILFYF
jgi:hypothetical protein